MNTRKFRTEVQDFLIDRHLVDSRYPKYLTGLVQYDLVEVHQAGIFTLKGMTPEQLHRTQHVFCLRFLHPYAIAAILDLITKGGFPQFLMPPVNFGERYTERYEKTEKASEPEAS